MRTRRETGTAFSRRRHAAMHHHRRGGNAAREAAKNTKRGVNRPLLGADRNVRPTLCERARHESHGICGRFRSSPYAERARHLFAFFAASRAPSLSLPWKNPVPGLKHFAEKPLTRRRCIASPDRTGKGITQGALVRRMEEKHQRAPAKRPRKPERTPRDTKRFRDPGCAPTKRRAVLPAGCETLRHCVPSCRLDLQPDAAAGSRNVPSDARSNEGVTNATPSEHSAPVL